MSNDITEPNNDKPYGHVTCEHCKIVFDPYTSERNALVRMLSTSISTYSMLVKKPLPDASKIMNINLVCSNCIHKRIKIVIEKTAENMPERF